MDVPAASCSASATSASASPRAWSSCVHSSMRRSASSSFASAARSPHPAASSRSAPSSVRRPASASGVAGGSCLPTQSLTRRSNRARVRCSSCSRSKRAWMAWRAASQRARRAASSPICQRLPAAIEFDHRGENRAGRGCQRFQLRQDRVRFGRLAGAIRDGLDPLPREPRHAVILVPGGVGELVQALRRVHALRGGHSHCRMLGADRDLDQRVLVAERGDRDAPAVRVRRAARHLGSDRIGALVGLQQCRRRLALLRFGKHGTQRGREGRAHRRIGFRSPGRGKRGDIDAAPGRRRADLRRRIGRQKLGELVRVRRQLRRAEHPLLVVGVLVQRGTK